MARSKDDDHVAIPATRAGRFAQMARMASGVAGGMLAEGTRQLRAGNRPRTRDMLLTPGNARRVADQLASMRGAAMKVGQMLSMDTGDFLPRELADALAKLRSEARSMPPAQLQQVMTETYGEDWEALFYGFSMKPIAAASIGQVHRTRSPDGRDIVLKVQYPGVANSIDSDVDGMMTLLRMTALIPSDIDLSSLIADAKAQLHDEADYTREAEYLKAFADWLVDDERYVVPEVLPELTHRQVLAMTYVEGQPIDVIDSQPQAERDRVMTCLIELMLRELFELRMVQTDPNFANYQYRPDTGEIVLLDFGATRTFSQRFVAGYKKLAKAAVQGDGEKLLLAADKLGYGIGDGSSGYRELMLELFLLALEPLRHEGVYDFGSSDLPGRLSELGERARDFSEFWEAPPTDAVFFHRKLGGMFMLASRVGARVDVSALIHPWIARVR